jgi:CRISPR/Cas system-associated exonuclease Cas4 (RecB family)
MNIRQINLLSQSSLQDYVDCALRFKLRYLDHLTYPAVESEPALENEKHQQEGEYFHRLVQQYLIGLPAEQVGKLANTANLRRWWDHFVQAFPERKQFGNVYPELTLSAPLGNYRLLAKYDLIAVKDGKATIYDWKTYRKRPRNEWLSTRMQTRVYRAMLVKAGAHLNNDVPFRPEDVEMIYWFADFPNEPARFNYTSDQYQRDWDILLKLSGEVTLRQAQGTSAYPQTDDRQKCAYCTYRSYCERGIGAGDWDEAEAEMQAEELFDVNFEQIGEIAF